MSAFLIYYIFIEVVFYLIYVFHLKPKANDLTSKTVEPFRDYGKSRHLLIQKILDRMETKCKLENKRLDDVLHTFFINWFFPLPSSTSTPTPTTSSSSIEDSNVTRHTLGRRSTSISSSDSITEDTNTDKHHYNHQPIITKPKSRPKPTFYKEDLMEFLTWAFFDKRYSDDTTTTTNTNNNTTTNSTKVSSWEKEELNKMFESMSKYGIVYPSYKDEETKSPTDIIRMKPRCYTLEQCNPLHRPLALYFIFLIIRHVGYLVLYWKGFRRFNVCIPSKNGGGGHGHGHDKVFYYWFRDDDHKLSKGCTNMSTSTSTSSDEDKDNDQKMDPILFFHGIAPAGLTFYLPLLCNTLMRGGSDNDDVNDDIQQEQVLDKNKERTNPIFLFENLPIACSLVFDIPTEEETLESIHEALSRHGFMSSQENEGDDDDDKDKQKQKLILCGHSFGTFQLTWLIKSPIFQKNIRKMILLDPVSILLSEPDVVVNFLYGRTADRILGDGGGGDGGDDQDQYGTDNSSILDTINRLKIKILASSEIGIEYYLRRHFAWYNSELWLGDVPESIDVSVYIAEKDDIIEARKVCKEIRRFPNVKLVSWKDLGHAAVVTNSELWVDIVDEFKYSALTTNHHHKKND